MFRNFMFNILMLLPAAGLALLTSAPAIASNDANAEAPTETLVQAAAEEASGLPTDPLASASDESVDEGVVSSSVIESVESVESVGLETEPSEAIAPTTDAPTVAQLVENDAEPSASENSSSQVSVQSLLNPSSDAAALLPSQSTMAQVTSVNQLSDVAPTDWAYQALTTLISRYGCIAGYPDGTFRGSQTLSRYEFAAGLNACLDSLSNLLSGGGTLNPGDLTTLEQLQEEFAAELATLRGRVDALEARTAELEANQFSTTTKLNGEVLFSLQAVFADDDNLPDSNRNGSVDDDQVTFGYRVEMNFDSSFTGDDRLRVRLRARDVQQFDADPIGFSYGGSEDGNVLLDNLFYDFPLSDRIDVRIGANSLAVDELVASTISPLDSSTAGSISDFGFPPQYSLAAPGDAGAGLIFQISDNLSLDLGYTAGNAANPADENGLFNGDFSLIAQLTYLSSKLDAALTYIRAYGTSGFASSQRESANTFGFQMNYRISDGIELGGGLAYFDTEVYDGNGNTTSDVDAWSYQVTLAFPDLFGEGNLAGILVGVPPRVTDVEVNGARVPQLIENASLVVEGFYRYRLNEHISITPGIIWIADPGNNNNNEDTVIGAIRTVFSF